MKKDQLIDIQEHCFKLRELLSQLDQFKYMLAIDWLDIAAGVESVEVTTAKYDDSTAYCRGAFEYEAKRSELLSHLTTKLTIFNFVWGSFESVAEALELSSLPKRLKQVGDSIVIRTLWSLKQNYDSEARLAFYDEELAVLLKLAPRHGFHNDNRRKSKKPNKSKKVNNHKKVNFSDYADLNGLGLDIVRRSRNALAHGSAVMPIPDDWGEGKIELSVSECQHLKFVNTSTRIVLLTVQMLLLSNLQDKGQIVEWLLDEEGDWIESTAKRALREIHLQTEETD